MPRVPMYERQVAPAPLPSARIGARFTPESLGAGVGQALFDIGLQVKRNADQIATTDADRRLGEFETDLLYGQRRR